MALPGFLAPSLTPQELTFLAEQEEIEIVPAFTMSPVRLIQVRSSAECLILQTLIKLIQRHVGRLWTVPTIIQNQGAALARPEPQAQEEG